MITFGSADGQKKHLECLSWNGNLSPEVKNKTKIKQSLFFFGLTHRASSKAGGK